MRLTPEIQQRISDLGGTVTPVDGPLEACLRAISFTDAPRTNRLLFDDFLDNAGDEQYAAFLAEPEQARSIFTYPELDWEVRSFTPFTPGTPDHTEWDGTIGDDALRGASGVSAATVIFLGFSDGWPNHFFVLAEDVEPANPTVYTTDHEVYFSEVERRGTLLDLLNELVTEAEFARAVQAALLEHQ